jgi:hypothetical protein
MLRTSSTTDGGAPKAASASEAQDDKIDVFGCTWSSVEGNCIATYDHIFNCLFFECQKQIVEVWGKAHEDP